MLSGYSDGYERIISEWSRIDYLHKKIFKFISTNLYRKYGIAVNDAIPAHLLGKTTVINVLDSASTLSRCVVVAKQY